MKRFKSKFAAIERIREQKEKLAAAQIAVAQKALQDASELLEISRRALSTTVDEIETTMNQSFAATSIKSGLRQTDVQQSAINQRTAELQHCQQQVDAAKQRRMTAFKDLRTVEEAGSRERAAYRKEQLAANLMIQMDNFRTGSSTANSATDPASVTTAVENRS